MQSFAGDASPQNEVLLQSRRQFWPTLTTRHASLVPVSAEALQRERRQMQAKHLWYNVDIRWSDLKDKLEVLAPTGLTRDDIWRHLFLTKQRKNPYEEGCTLEKTWKMSNKNGKIRSTISSNTRRMSLALLALSWREPFLALTLTTLQHFRQLMTQKLYTHVDGRPRKVRTALRGEPFLMYETRLSRMIMQLPPAQMANRDGDAGMETMLWDINIIPNELDYGYLMLPPGSTYECVGPLRTFHPLLTLRFTFQTLAGFCVVLCFGFGGVLLLCGVFVSCFASVWNPEFSAQLDLDDRQGFIASSAMQQKKKNHHKMRHLSSILLDRDQGLELIVTFAAGTSPLGGALRHWRSCLSPSIFSISLLPLTLSYRPGLSLWQVPPFHPPSSLSPSFYPFPLPPIGPACHCGRSRQFLDFTSCS